MPAQNRPAHALVGGPVRREVLRSTRDTDVAAMGSSSFLPAYCQVTRSVLLA
jgi:hypothetical protein